MEPDRTVLSKDSPLEYQLRKYLLLLATLVATVTYAAGFNPPGGFWQDTDGGYLPGEPVIRATDYRRYLIFYYCNATAFASSIVVIVLILVHAIQHERKIAHETPNTCQDFIVVPLRLVMVLDLLALMGGYAAGTGRDTVTWVLVIVIFVSVVFHMLLASCSGGEPQKGDTVKKRHRKVLMLLATFVTSISYVSGLSAPGGFWDSSQDGHRAGDPILQERHSRRLRAFFFCNTIAFAESLLIIVLLLDRKMHKKGYVRCCILYASISIALFGLGGAYVVGSCREMNITIYLTGLAGAVLVFICIQVIVFYLTQKEQSRPGCLVGESTQTSQGRQHCQTAIESASDRTDAQDKDRSATRSSGDKTDAQETDAQKKAYSLVILLATLVVTVTYQAALVPPGGSWQDNQDGHTAGEPVLLSTNPKRYKVFFYCNSAAFVASLVVIILVRSKPLLKHHALERIMILDLFSLMGAYAAGSCREIGTSIYVIALAGAVLVYVVIHVVLFTHEGNRTNPANDDDRILGKRRKRLLLFAVLGTTLTYQAGLTPPSGFQLKDDEFGHRAGDPILFHNFPRRYNAFFYCNSVSFMSSIALIILLANSNLYKPAIRSYALSVCTAAGLFGLMGAYAVGSTQHLKTSIYIFALVVLALSLVIMLLVIYWRNSKPKPGPHDMASKTDGEKDKSKQHAKRKYLMLLGVLAAGVTYQAGLSPPGGVWQVNSSGHAAGDPVMNDNRKNRYLAFFYSNSISFAASILVIILLLLKPLHQCKWYLDAMNITIVLDLLGLLVAYAAGCSTEWKAFGHVIVLVVPALVCVAIYILPSFKVEGQQISQASQSPQEGKQ